MRIAAIVMLWDGQEVFPHTIRHIRPLVDGVIIIFSNHSNYGEFCDNGRFLADPLYRDCFIFPLEPGPGSPLENEIRKRNYGLQKARELGFSHFLMLDSDELYEREPFLMEKERLRNESLNGLVCRSQLYFRSPKLTIGIDVTLVPFLHKIHKDLVFSKNNNYPWARSDDDGKPFTETKRIRIDPSRQLSYVSGIEWSKIIMHHMSWVRKDPKRKVRNSTSRGALERSAILQDFARAKEGYFCEFYQKTLHRAGVDFGIPEIANDSP